MLQASLELPFIKTMLFDEKPYEITSGATDSYGFLPYQLQGPQKIYSTLIFLGGYYLEDHPNLEGVP